MAANSKISWTDHTFNPWVGCTRVSPGCDGCYAADWAARAGRGHLWEGAERELTKTWGDPVKWNREAEAAGVPAFVFCASLADVFDNEALTDWRADLFRMIERTPHLRWLLLTKRVGNVVSMMREISCPIDSPWPGNAWLGSTVVNQPEADRDIPKLLAAKAALSIPRVFLSVEPMLGGMNITHHLEYVCQHENAYGDPETGAWECSKCDAGEWEPPVDWVICGGESGKNARPMHPDWARSLRDQCAAAGVAFHFKQWGEWGPMKIKHLRQEYDRLPRQIMDGRHIIRAGKSATGRLLDGVEHNGRPPA